VTTTRTRRDLIDRALSELGVIAAGQTPSAEDVSAVDQLVDAVCDELSTREIVYIDAPGEPGPDGGEIEPGVFLPLASWLANVAAPDFGAQYSPEVEAALETRLRRITATRPTYQPMQAEHF